MLTVDDELEAVFCKDHDHVAKQTRIWEGERACRVVFIGSVCLSTPHIEKIMAGRLDGGVSS